jgi:hypothetical protein
MTPKFSVGDKVKSIYTQEMVNRKALIGLEGKVTDVKIYSGGYYYLVAPSNKLQDEKHRSTIDIIEDYLVFDNALTRLL